MNIDAARLFDLLPAVYRLRDVKDLAAGDQNQLRALIGVIAEQIGILQEDLAQLYDDEFVDTCADWVVPYIGDLLGNTPLYAGRADEGRTARSLFPDLTGPRFAPRVAMRGRADVARTIYYRKRKATRPMLELLAHDVTGWAARVVEFFELLAWTQCIRNHLLPQRTTVDVRNLDKLERLDGAFDEIVHEIDVAPISQSHGWYEIRNIGFFLWRLNAYGIDGGDPRPAGGGDFFFFHPAGIDAPLFSSYRPDEFSGVTETRVPAPIRPLRLALDIRDYRKLDPALRPPFSELYGDAGASQSRKRSILIVNGGVPVPPEKICSANLATFKAPPGDLVAVDTKLGRIAFGAGRPANDPRVFYHYGFSADLGGGPYPRASWLIKRAGLQIIHVSKGGAVTSIDAAVAQWQAGGRKNTIIEIDDNRTYFENNAITLDPPPKGVIAIEAANRKRPHIVFGQPLTIASAEQAVVTLSGLSIEGSVAIDNARGQVRLLHSTIRPAATPSIVANDAAARSTVDPLRLDVAFSITGAIAVTGMAHELAILDSIVDAPGAIAVGGLAAADYAPPATIERCTIFGATRVREMPLATNSIFDEALLVERRQAGCVRFCYVPPSVSRTPRRYRCQPDLEVASELAAKKEDLGRKLLPAETAAITAVVNSWDVPAYTSRRYGDPGFAQLHLNAPRQIARGADDGSEMGVFCHLKQPQRADNLTMRLAEYLPFGLEAGIIYVT